MKAYQIIIFIVMLSTLVMAHQPRIVSDEVIVVEEVTVSKAYYGELEGADHVYKLSSEEEFPIYVNILIPGRELTHTVSVELLKGGEVIDFLDGEDFEWEEYWEEHARDWYMRGPELGKDFKSTQNLEAGEYEVRVFNSGNEGKYVIAIGPDELFPVSEILKATLIVPILKVGFFGKYYWLLLPLLLGLGFLYLAKKKKLF